LSTRIHLCGHLRLEVDGEDRTDRLRGRQGRALFAFLVWHRDRPVRRDELVEALWSGEGRPPSDSSLTATW
jgi:DNA-binding SARP family transcriptional activator